MVEKQLLRTYKINCRGTSTLNFPALDKSQSVPVIVKIYRNGSSVPSCACYRESDGMCVAPVEERDYAPCTYI